MTASSTPDKRTAGRGKSCTRSQDARRRATSLSHHLDAIEFAPIEGVERVKTPPFVGFEGWTRTVGAVCIANGFARILTNQPDFQGQFDEETEKLLHFIERWAPELGANVWVTPSNSCE